MATRTANVMARVEPDVKEQAENILDRLGVPASVVINACISRSFTETGFRFLWFCRLRQSPVTK